MSTKWRIISLGAVAIALFSFWLYLSTSTMEGFLNGFLPSLAASMIILAIGIWLIEGPVMTRERRLSKVVALTARPIVQANEGTGIILVREIGELLASKLDVNVNLYGEERGDWILFKNLLRSVFLNAKQVPNKGLPKSERLTDEQYQNIIDSTSKFTQLIHTLLGSNLEVQARLLEIVEHLAKVDANIVEARAIRKDEKKYYAVLGMIGDSLIDLIDSCPKVNY